MDELAKTDPKNAKMIGKDSSGKPIWKTKSKIETDAMILFMENDYFKRYYENDPRATKGLIPKEVSRAGQLEWLSLSASEKASWIAKVNNTRADELAKTDPKIAEQTEMEKMVAFAKTNWKPPKNAKMIGKDTSGEPIWLIKSTIETHIETDAMMLFMKDDYLKRYYENRPRPTNGRIPKDVDHAGQLIWLSKSASEKAAWVAKVNNMRADKLAKTDPKIAEQTEKEKMDELAKTDPKIAEQIEKEKMVAFAKSNRKPLKDAKMIGKDSSGKPIWKTKSKIETDAMILFMENDYFKRYYENDPRATKGLIPKEVSRAGQLEWLSLSASEKASWIAKVNNTRADELAKTDPKIAEQTEMEKMVAFAKTNWKPPKNAKMIGKDTSGEPIWLIKSTIETHIETDAMMLFMKDDYLKRYYENRPRPTNGRIPKDVDHAGQLIWLSKSASEKAAWIAKVNNMRADLASRYDHIS